MFKLYHFMAILCMVFAPQIIKAYDCSYATELSCGDDLWYATSSSNNFNSSNTDCTSSSWDYNGTDRLFYFDAGSTTTSFTVELYGLSADLDLMIYSNCTSGHPSADLTGCVGSGLKGGSSSESVTINSSSGRYYILVDGYSSGISTDFDIRLTCNSSGGGGGYGSGSGCSSASYISCGTTRWVGQSSTNSFDKDNYDMTNCDWAAYDYDGTDHVYVVDAGSSSTDLSISVTGLSDDLDVFVYRTCSSGNFSNCAGSSIESSKKSEYVTIPNATGTYYIVVDGYHSWVRSGYEISVQCQSTYVPPPSNCGYATTLRCGDNKWINAPSSNSFSSTAYDFSSCFNQNYTYGGNDDLYKIELGSSPQDIEIKLSGLSADLDMFLFKSCQGYNYSGDRLSNCAAYSHSSGTTSESITLTGASGTYYLAIDGYNAWANSGYEISLNCYNAQPDYNCYDARSLSCGSSTWVNAPYTNNLGGSDYNFYGCFNSNLDYKGKDHLYKVDAGNYPTELSIKLTGLTADMDLFVFKSCGSSYGGISLNNCVDHSFRSGSSSEEVVIPNATGTYYIAVDAYDPWDNSGYEIDIDCYNQPPDQPCTVASELKCGDWVNGSNSSSDSRSSDRINDHSGCSYGSGYNGREVIYKIRGGSSGLRNVKVALNNQSNGANFELFVYEGCVSSYNQYNGDWNYNMNSLIDCSQSSAYSSSKSVIIDYIAPYEEVYVIVDTKSGWGQFELGVTCNDLCDHSIRSIECGESHSSNTTGSGNFASSYTCDSSEDNSGSERVYKLNIDETTDIRIDLEVGGEADLNLYLLQYCSTTSCIGKSSWRGKGKDEYIEKSLSRGSYYIVVDGYAGQSGSYKLNVSGCGCSNATRLQCDTPISGSTVGATNRLTEIKDECFRTASYPVDLDGPDQFYTFIAPETGEYTFTLTELENNVDLYLMTDCTDKDACVDFSTKGGVNNEIIRQSLSKNDEIYLVVDSRHANWASSFVIEAVCIPDEEEEEEEEEEPTGELSFTIAKSGGTFSIDLTSAIDTSCANRKLTAAQVDPETGDLLSVEDQDIDIDSSGITEFEPTASNELTAYSICYQQQCLDDAIEVVCKTIIVDPVLSCGDTYKGTTIGGVSSFFKEDIDDCYMSSSPFDGPDQLIKFTKEDSSDILQLTLSHDGSNLSLFIFDEDMNPVGMTCKGSNFNASKMISNSRAMGESYTDRDHLLDAGTYYALIEGFDRDISADFSLSVACGFWCKGITKLTCGKQLEGENSVTDSTYSLNSIYYIAEDTAVVAYSGAERVYQLNVDVEQELTITVDNMTADADFDLFLLGSDCAEGVVMDYSINDGQTAESITSYFTVGYYRLVVDGWNGSNGSYDISVSACDDPGAETEPMVELRSLVDQPESLQLTKLTAQSYPNPFISNASLLIESPLSQTAVIKVFSTDGSLLHKIVANLNQGVNTVDIGADEIGNSSGILFYTVESSSDMVHGKMLKLR